MSKEFDLDILHPTISDTQSNIAKPFIIYSFKISVAHIRNLVA